MLRIAMPKTRGGETITVVVNDHRTIDNLVAPILIDVGYDVVMIAIAIPRATTVIAIPTPAFRPLVRASIKVHSNHFMPGIDTSSKEQASLASIKERRTKEILRRAVPITVTPGFIKVCLVTLQPFQRVFHLLVDITCLTIQIQKKLRS